MTHRPHPRIEREQTIALRWRDLSIALGAVLAVILLSLIGQALHPSTAEAKGVAWQPARATWYGPGFYGNGTACGQHYDIHIRGVAVPSAGPRALPCGTRITICRHDRCVPVRVIDTGGFRDHQFDLSARTAMDLCRCWRPYTMSVHWRRGWPNPPSART